MGHGPSNIHGVFDRLVICTFSPDPKYAWVNNTILRFPCADISIQYIDSGTADWDMRMAGVTHLVSSSGGPAVLGFDGLLKQLFSWYALSHILYSLRQLC